MSHKYKCTYISILRPKTRASPAALCIPRPVLRRSDSLCVNKGQKSLQNPHPGHHPPSRHFPHPPGVKANASMPCFSPLTHEHSETVNLLW
eukprot:822660-Amorphochlora_amoeboformis.AAC.1